MSFFNTREIAFGLDISDRSLRLAQLCQKTGKIKVQLFNEVKLPLDCVKSGEIKNQKQFLEALHKLIKTRHGSGKLSDEVISVLPEEKTFMKVIEMENTNDDPDKTVSAIKKILPQHIPIDLDQTYIDWQIIKTERDRQKVLIGASPQKIIDSYVSTLIKAKLIPTVLEIESAPISRLVLDQKEKSEPQIIIDIGANRTGLFLYDEDTIKFTISLPISGNKITKLIVDTLDIDFEKAEQAKMVCGLDRQKCHGALLEIFADTIKELEKHIKSAMNFYSNNCPSNKGIKKITLCGGGSNLINIDKILEESVDIPVVISNPWLKIENPDKKFFTEQKSQSFLTAMGLALRGLRPETFL